MPDSCTHCGSSNLIKRGTRKTKKGPTQMWGCRDCGRRFSLSPLPGKTYSAAVMLAAPVYYFMGYSLEKTKRRLRSRFHVSPSVQSIANWVDEFGKYSGIKKERDQIRDFDEPQNIIRRKMLQHDQTYLFQAHRYKLSRLDKRLTSLGDYLEKILKGQLIKPSEFGLRGSSLRLGLSVDGIKPRQTYATRIAELALKAAKTNSERHSALQRFFLATDLQTLAVEVPVFLRTDETRRVLKMPGGLLGHVDFLQVYQNRITILDYKPGAAKEKHVRDQLFLYALALSARTGIHLKQMQCAWFDETGYYSFPAIGAYGEFKKQPAPKSEEAPAGQI